MTGNSSLYRVAATADKNPHLVIKNTIVRDAGLYTGSVSYKAGLKKSINTTLRILCKSNL